MFNISGNTYPVKDQLKALGCKWSPNKKCWITSNEQVYRTAMELVHGAGRAQKSTYRKPYVPVASKPEREDIRIEYPSRGATYSSDEYGVYRYDTYPRSSVLAGQQRRQFLGTFETLEQAQAEYPSAELSGCGFQRPFLDHLSDEEEPDFDIYPNAM